MLAAKIIVMSQMTEGLRTQQHLAKVTSILFCRKSLKNGVTGETDILRNPNYGCTENGSSPPSKRAVLCAKMVYVCVRLPVRGSHPRRAPLQRS